VPGEDGASSLREIQALIGDEPATARVMLERPPSEVPPEHPLSRAIAIAAGDPVLIGVAYWMDMALLNAAGIPAVAYGPAGEGEHADVEWVDVASVERCVEVYLKAAEVLCS
jgi:acetylornithine deacetylase